MARFAPITVTFRFGGRDFTISGWASVRDMFVNGVETPMIYAQLGDPNLDFQPLLIEETGETDGAELQDGGQEEEPNDEPWQEQESEELRDEGQNEEVYNDDANSVSAVPPSPEHRRRRSRDEEEENEDDGGLELPHLKKRKIMELPSESEEEWSPVHPPRLPGGRWADEGPSDHQVEIWEEIWDDQLEERFEKEKRKTQDSGMNRDGLVKKKEGYGTEYIEWEAKEVIDLVSTSEDSG